MFSAGISADLEFRVDRSKRYNFYRDRRKQGDFAETVENATKQGDRINPELDSAACHDSSEVSR